MLCKVVHYIDALVNVLNIHCSPSKVYMIQLVDCLTPYLKCLQLEMRCVTATPKGSGSSHVCVSLYRLWIIVCS